MSVFSNRASRSKEESKAYRAAVLDLMSGRSPAEVLETTPGAIIGMTEGLSSEQGSRPEAEGKWSIRHVVRHLADSELVWGYRLRKVLAEERPRLTGFDQDRWARRLGYERTTLQTALRDFSTLRKSNLRLVKSLESDDLRRTALHSERGEQSLAELLKLYAGHDLLHLRQLERIRARVVLGDDTRD